MIVSTPRRTRGALLGVTVVLAACSDSPMDLRPTDTPPPITAVAVACRVDVTREIAQCASGAPGSGSSVAMATAAAMAAAPRIPDGGDQIADVVDLGGQGSTVGIDLLDLGRSGDTLLVATVRLTNRLDQPLGMITPVALDVDAVRLGIVDGPTALPSGTVTVDAADGQAFFTAANQPFARFEAPIQPNARQWRDIRFRLSPGVTGFTFRAIVRAALPDEAPARITGQSIRFEAVNLSRSAFAAVGGCLLSADTRMPFCFGNNELGQVGNGGGQIIAPRPAGHGRFTRLTGSALGNMCGLRVDARWFCWGLLPPFIGETDVVSTDVRRVFPGIAAREIAIGSSFGCALDADGRAWCAGDNQYGATGSGTIGNFTATVSRVVGGLTFRSLSVGNDFICGVTQGRAVFCWGRNDEGQLGQGTTTSRPTPTRIAAVTDSVVQVATYSNGACALTQGGAVWCWGSNLSGTVGNGVISDNVVIPTAVITTGAVQLAAGDQHMCARRTGGTIDCWGANGAAQTGVQVGGDVPEPTPIGASGYTADTLVAGGDVTCFRQAANWTCFGRNFEGEAGVEPAGTVLPPTQVSGLNGLRQVVLGRSGGCGLTTTDDLWCWGRGLETQFPSGAQRSVGVPTGVFGGRAFAQVEIGEAWACGLRPAGGVYCWGRNPATSVTSTTPDTVLTGVGFRRLTVGSRHACGLSLADSTAWCWGNNASGQLGVSGPATATPVQVSATLRFAQITAGLDFTCALDGDGAPWCWGSNVVGQLGRGTSGAGVNATPQRVLGTLRFTSLETGVFTACGITAAREAICWGGNGGNLMGIGEGIPFTPTPVVTIAILQVRQLAIGNNVGCGVSVSGEAYCGGQGALGTGFSESGTLRRVPIPVPVTRVSVGTSGACAVDVNARVWCWGVVGFPFSNATPTLVTLR